MTTEHNALHDAFRNFIKTREAMLAANESHLEAAKYLYAQYTDVSVKAHQEGTDLPSEIYFYEGFLIMVHEEWFEFQRDPRKAFNVDRADSAPVILD